MGKSRGQGSGVRGLFACQPTETGFKWGPVEIERIETAPEDISEAVTLRLKTEDIDLEIYVTRVGIVRIYVPSGERVILCGAERKVPK
jgi:hypothetical protein